MEFGRLERRWRVSGIVVVVVCVIASLGEGCLDVERNALLQIKQDLNYPNGSSLSGWIGNDCCKWDGVSCDFSTPPRVTEIDISGKRENGLGRWHPNATLFAQFKYLTSLNLAEDEIAGWTMPQGFYGLQSLTTLYLWDNQLSESNTSCSELCGLTNLRDLSLASNNLEDDSIPLCFGNLSNLEGLELSGNNLRSQFGISKGFHKLQNLQSLDLRNNDIIDEGLAPWIGNLTSLQTIVLFGNNLKDSSLLAGICELRNLTYLYLNDNKIEGRIHPCLGNMHSLKFLGLSNNRFNGGIPPLDNLTSIGEIHLSNNQLDGFATLSTFANLSSLYILNLSSNPLLEVATESPTWVPSFSLTYLSMSNSRINKQSGGSIPSFLSTQYRIMSLELSQCGLVGSIPSWLLYNFTNLVAMTLSGNSLGGTFPRPSQTYPPSTVWLDISDNHVHGSLPTDLHALLPTVRYLNMSRNALQGNIPSSISDSSLEILDLSNNNFSGEIPHKLLVRSTSLKYLSLSNNRLHGDILQSYDNVTSLQRLHLDGNLFTGPILGPFNSTSLKTLDIRRNFISGTIPSWLPTLSNLTSLLLSGNDIVGSIPMVLCQMQNLRMMDLSNNGLSGNIPSCFDNVTAWKEEYPVEMEVTMDLRFFSELLKLRTDFTTKGRSYSYEGIPLSLMTGIDLSMNQLTGNIPSEVGYLKVLRSLNLSNNLLTGHIPISFQDLDKLESLDLSHNTLSGPIPSQIMRLHALSTFNVSFNNLSGRLPDFKGQFGTFDENSYVGNLGLCGRPLERSCSFDNPSPTHDEGEGDDADSGIADNPALFYSCIALSHALGFWGFMALLFFNKNWRQMYFTTIDRYSDSIRKKLSKTTK